jgi:NADH:ubiquinone oxidoreductase subunit E
MHTHQHTHGEQGSTIFDKKVRAVAMRLGMPVAQVREVFAAYDAITMEWAHTDEEQRSSASSQ